MKQPSTLWLLPLVTLFSNVVLGTITKGNYVWKLQDQQTKEVMEKLLNVEDNVNSELEQSTLTLKEENDVLSAYNKYNDALQSSKDGSCKPKDPPPLKGKEDIDALVDKCVSAGLIPGDYKKAFEKKVDDAKKNVESINTFLEQATHECSGKTLTNFWAESCQEKRTRLRTSMDLYFSHTKNGNIREDSLTLIEKGKEQLSACFGKETGDIMSQLKEATKKIEDCMGVDNTEKS